MKLNHNNILLSESVLFARSVYTYEEFDSKKKDTVAEVNALNLQQKKTLSGDSKY